MLRRLLLAGLFLSATSLSLADEPKKELPKKEEPKSAEKPTLADKIKTLQTEFSKSNAEAVKAINAEKDKAAREKLIEEYQNGRTKFAGKVLEVVKEDPKAEGALTAFQTCLALSSGDDKMFGEVVSLLLANHIDNTKITDLFSMLSGNEKGQQALEQIGEKAKSKTVQGHAKFVLVQGMIESTDYPRNGKPMAAEAAAKKFAEAEAKLKSVVAQYGEEKIPAPRGKGTVTIADASKKLTFFVEHLVVGKAAPAVECSTLDDEKKAKLSDYKGKVVVLDVWATWCPPCRAMIPHERDMVKKLKDKPFALISVSADAKKDTLTDFLKKEEMPWTHWWNGSTGNLLETYQIRFYPTIYVIDAKGVIRHKHLRGDDLEHAVEKLIAEMEKSESK